MKAVLIDSSGRLHNLPCFTFEENTEVDSSCSLTWQNSFYVYGGNKNRYQISQVVGKELKLIGRLKYLLYLGACSVMKMNKIFLCFSMWGERNCRVSTNPKGPFYYIQAESHHEHSYSDIDTSDCKWFNSDNHLLSISAQLLVIGAHRPKNKKVEIYNDERGDWTTIGDYPYSLSWSDIFSIQSLLSLQSLSKEASDPKK